MKQKNLKLDCFEWVFNTRKSPLVLGGSLREHECPNGDKTVTRWRCIVACRPHEQVRAVHCVIDDYKDVVHT